MTEQDFENLAKKIAKETVREFLLSIGVATSDETSVLALQADFQHLRRSRLAVAAVGTKALLVLTGTFFTFIAGAVYMALMGRGGTPH